jgi:hypothetical protein
MGKLLTRQDILSIRDIRAEVVSVPEWGGDVKIKAMSGKERDAWESALFQISGKDVTMNKENLRAKLVALTAVDEANVRLFTEADIEALGAKSAAALDRVYQASQKLSGLTPDDIKELEKNLETDHSDSTASNSQK